MIKYNDLYDFCNNQNIAAVKDQLLRDYTSFRIGGPVPLVVEPGSQEEVSQVLFFCTKNDIPHFFLGNGSNILAPDQGIDRVMIRLDRKMSEMTLLPGGMLECEAGAKLSSLCNFAMEHALSGLEFAYGIPGNVGGAVYMNAGAYGGEIKDVIDGSWHVDENGAPGYFSKEQLHMSYRHSVYAENPNLCITKARFQLSSGDREQIKERMETLMGKRKEKQPIELPSAGSMFKRPNGHYAAALIQECGLKGMAVGDACVSEKHCGFIVNKGSATAYDVKTLIQSVQDIVREKTGYELECEVKML